MAKRKHTAARSRIYNTADRPKAGFSRRDQMLPPSSRRSNTIWWWLGGAAVVVGGLVVLALAMGWIGKPAASPSPAPTSARPSFANLAPPAATPLASPPAAPASDGTTATIDTDLGTIVFKVYTDSAPVAAQNFINLADVGYYDGVVFHRVVPNFMIQGGDPEGTGGGGPGYTIQDEPVVGQYARGVVAMARTSEVDSQGSQFFIVLDDAAKRSLDTARTYVIFGRVTSGMDVVDTIARMPNAGQAKGNAAVNPIAMDRVTVSRP
jgi:peptidyl-prolyl cis-trans isomerase B (cyclophilin B)